jgi:hypothetical protein
MMAVTSRNVPDAAPYPYESSFLPDFCSARSVLLVVLSAELLACTLTLASGDTGQIWLDPPLISLFIQCIALGNILMLCLSRPKSAPEALGGRRWVAMV